MKIRHLKTAYGDFLDLEGRVVGDFFDDRGTDGNIRNSILEVHRYPPRPDEIEALQRFSSLAPNSSARPQKRRLELPSQSYVTQNSQILRRAIPSIEEWDAEATVPYGSASKRQRTHESRPNDAFDAHQGLMRRKDHEVSSQTAARQESVRQVVDSQKLPAKKRASTMSGHSILFLTCHEDQTPYGTPTSLPLGSLQESISNNDVNLSAIPDSPLTRQTAVGGETIGRPVQLDRESTKSESPELGASIHDVSSADRSGAPGEQPVESPRSPAISAIPHVNSSALEGVPILPQSDQNLNNHSLDLSQNQKEVLSPDRTHERRSPPANPQYIPGRMDPQHKPNSIFDPIESDSESFNEKQQMQSAKRLRSGKKLTASSRSLQTSSKVGNRKDGQFLVPSLPQARTEGARKSPGRAVSSDRRANIQVLVPSSGDAKASIDSASKIQEKHNAKTLKDTLSELYDSDGLSIERELPKGNTECNGPMDTAPNLSEATVASSQDCNEYPSGTIDSSNQTQDNRASSLDKEPKKATNSGDDVNGAKCNSDGDRCAQEAERVAKETEKQLETRRLLEQEAEWQQPAKAAVDKESAAAEQIAGRRFKEKAPADKRGPEQNRPGVGDFHPGKKSNAKGAKLAETKRAEKTRLNEAQLLKEKESRKGLSRERQIKETSLAEEADRLMLAAEGAKQIEAEKERKEKIRREELATKEIADEAKADEQASEAQGKGKDGDKKGREEQFARANAQNPKGDHDRNQRARTEQKFAMSMLEQAEKRLADRCSSEAQGHASTNPSKFSNSSDKRRSLTPHIPGSSIMKSSRLNSLASTPFSNRSSGDVDAPPRSSLRKTPGPLRRSVSSVSFDFQPQSSSQTPVKPLYSNKAANTKLAKTPAKPGKVQTKLNVKRQPKKLKGRAISPLVTPKQPPKQNSLGAKSSSSKKPVWQTGNAEAGPSSRKPIFPAPTSQGKRVSEAEYSGASIDPIIRSLKIEKDTTVASTALPRSASRSETTSLQKSNSRSPALALSETISSSCDTPITISSDSDDESDLEVEPRAPSRKTPTGTKNGKLAPVITKRPSEVVSVGAKPQAGNLKSTVSSQPRRHTSSSQSRTLIPTSTKDKHLDQAADKQLQLESRQSIPRSGAEQVSPTAKNDRNIINQGLDHAGRLPNGIRPAYYKYPALSELQKLSRAATAKVESKMGTSSQPLDAESNESSSDSDESSTNSDAVGNVNEPSSQNASQQKSRPYPGLSKLIESRLSCHGRVCRLLISCIVASVFKPGLGASQQ